MASSPTLTAGPDPTPFNAMGRFAHEALAIDPATGWVYEPRMADRARGSIASGRRPQARSKRRRSSRCSASLVFPWPTRAPIRTTSGATWCGT